MKKNRIVKAGDDNHQIRYTEQEKQIIDLISVQLKLIDAATPIVGELIDRLVGIKGGIKYGNKTIKRIAEHPDICGSEQHLRRCWNTYRLKNVYGAKITPDHVNICDTSLYQIARLLDLEMDEQAMIAIIDECIHKAIKRGLPADEVRVMVSRRLDEFGKLRKRPTGKKPETDKSVVEPPVVSESDLFDFAEGISYMADPLKFPTERVTSAEARTGIIRLLVEVVTISRRLQESGPNHDLGNVLIRKADELREIGQQLLEPESEENKVA